MKLSIRMLAFASLISGCKSGANKSTEEGIAFEAQGSVQNKYYNIQRYLDDPQLIRIATNMGPVQIWFVPKFFGGDNGELHVCAYYNNDPDRAVNKYDNEDISDYDLERFATSQVLKGGKYVNWSDLFQVLTNERNSGKWDSTIQETFAATGEMLKDEKNKLKHSLGTVLEDMAVRKPIITAGPYGEDHIDPNAITPESELAGLLLILDRVQATDNDCPSAQNLAEKAKVEGAGAK